MRGPSIPQVRCAQWPQLRPDHLLHPRAGGNERHERRQARLVGGHGGGGVAPAYGEAADAGARVAAAVVGGGGEPYDVGRGKAVAEELSL